MISYPSTQDPCDIKIRIVEVRKFFYLILSLCLILIDLSLGKANLEERKAQLEINERHPAHPDKHQRARDYPDVTSGEEESPRSFANAQDEPSGSLKNSLRAQINSLMRKIKEQYGIGLFYKDFPSPSLPDVLYEFAVLQDDDHLLKFLKLFESEIQKYPKNFFQKTQFGGFYLVKKFFYKKRPAEGYYDYQRNVIVLDFLRNHNKSINQKHNIHHEIFHMMDFNRRKDLMKEPDEVWIQFNDPGFVYGQNKFKDQMTREVDWRGPPLAGFMTEYSLFSTEEDMAEIYACLFVESQNQIMQRWMKESEILRKKVNYIKKLIYDYSREMDEKYWVNLFAP